MSSGRERGGNGEGPRLRQILRRGASSEKRGETGGEEWAHAFAREREGKGDG